MALLSYESRLGFYPSTWKANQSKANAVICIGEGSRIVCFDILSPGL